MTYTCRLPKTLNGNRTEESQLLEQKVQRGRVLQCVTIEGFWGLVAGFEAAEVAGDSYYRGWGSHPWSGGP